MRIEGLLSPLIQPRREDMDVDQPINEAQPPADTSAEQADAAPSSTAEPAAAIVETVISTSTSTEVAVEVPAPEPATAVDQAMEVDGPEVSTSTPAPVAEQPPVDVLQAVQALTEELSETTGQQKVSSPSRNSTLVDGLAAEVGSPKLASLAEENVSMRVDVLVDSEQKEPAALVVPTTEENASASQPPAPPVEELDDVVDREKASTPSLVLAPTTDRTGYIYDPLMMLHAPDGYTPTSHLENSGDNHPEEPMRIKRIFARLSEQGLIRRMKKLDFQPVTFEQVALVHTEDQWNKVSGTECECH